MSSPPTFAEVVDAADELTDAQQEQLLQIIRRRLAERGRQRVLDDVREAEADHAAGRTKVVTVDDLMDEITS
jgi:hypothetical protein